MRCGAMQSRRGKNGNDVCFGSYTWYVHSTHHWTMSHPHKECSIPTSGRKSEYSWSLNVFLRSFSLSHITTHIQIFTSNQIPSKGVIFSFCKTKPLNVMQCYVGHLGSKCSCMQWQYALPTYSWHNSIASIIEQYMHFYIEFPKISD